MKQLIRIKVDNFTIEESILLDNLDSLSAGEKLISIEKIFENKPEIKLNARKLELFLNGVNLTYELKDEIYRIYNENVFIGLGIVKNKLLKRDIVI